MYSIVWDLYNTDKYELMKLENFTINKEDFENLGITRLAKTSGNILQINDDGSVLSVLKNIEQELEQKKDKSDKVYYVEFKEDIWKQSNGKQDKKHIIYYDKNIDFNPIVNDKEPWVFGDYERKSYCLYQNKKCFLYQNREGQIEEGTAVETLQLIIGRTTVQIWHQIQDNSKNKDDLPNKGEAFLEYIWVNHIPINQEREKTRLRIDDDFKYRLNGDKLGDFHLKVYWYMRVTNKDNENVKNGEQEINEEIDKMKEEGTKKSGNVERREKIIERKDIIEKFHAVRHACEALEHLKKRYKNLAKNYMRVHEVG